MRIFKEKRLQLCSIIAWKINRAANRSVFLILKPNLKQNLTPQNRWVKLANLLNWDALAKIYATTLSSDMGAKAIDARVVLGALIIKHLEKKDDRGMIEIIQENPYMQYFLGFDSFQFKPVFDPSLLVHIRKRLGNEAFDKMNQIIILSSHQV